MYLILRVDVTGADLGYYAGVRIDKERAETIMERFKRVDRAGEEDDQIYAHEYWCYWPDYQPDHRLFDKDFPLGEEIAEACESCDPWFLNAPPTVEEQFSGDDCFSTDVNTMKLITGDGVQFTCLLKNSNIVLETAMIDRDLIEKIAAA